jgi:hypothetical protein
MCLESRRLARNGGPRYRKPGLVAHRRRIDNTVRGGPPLAARFGSNVGHFSGVYRHASSDSRRIGGASRRHGWVGHGVPDNTACEC